jgi:hypothetical protein
MGGDFEKQRFGVYAHALVQHPGGRLLYTNLTCPDPLQVCEKVFVQKRKVFNVVEARVAGTEAAKYIDIKKGVPKSELVGERHVHACEAGLWLAYELGRCPPKHAPQIWCC